jgi:hypothetical protein
MFTPHIIFFFFDSTPDSQTTEVGLSFIARERLQWTGRENRLHWQTRPRIHWTGKENRLHWTIRKRLHFNDREDD